jgi:hypothetical protein
VSVSRIFIVRNTMRNTADVKGLSGCAVNPLVPFYDYYETKRLGGISEMPLKMVTMGKALFFSSVPRIT